MEVTHSLQAVCEKIHTMRYFVEAIDKLRGTEGDEKRNNLLTSRRGRVPEREVLYASVYAGMRTAHRLNHRLGGTSVTVRVPPIPKCDSRQDI